MSTSIFVKTLYSVTDDIGKGMIAFFYINIHPNQGLKATQYSQQNGNAEGAMWYEWKSKW